VDRFTCLACKAETLVRHIKCDTTGTYFVCEHCGGEHAVQVLDVPLDQATRFEILRLRSEGGDGARPLIAGTMEPA